MGLDPAMDIERQQAPNDQYVYYSMTNLEQTLNVVIDHFCLQLEKQVQAYNFVTKICIYCKIAYYITLLVKKKLVSPEIFILTNNVDNTITLYNSKNIGQSQH